MSPSVSASVSRHFDFPADRVFDAWLDPAWLGRWMYGPAVRDETIVRLGLEPRVGGRFSFVVNRAGTEVDHVGEYLEIDRPRLLVFSWGTRDALPETSRVVVEIVPSGDGCDLTVTHVMDARWAAFSARAEQSWRTMLSALATALAETAHLSSAFPS